ncbi:MAG: hypothetical protein O7C63_06260 [Alphaproteobacteria bacterium]|nr:hypothetical protein [Alphaproteobacteria bacterium]
MFVSNINIGVRHILILLPLLAIGAAYASARFARTGRTPVRVALFALLAWQLATALSAHPDNMPYFNLVAGSQPERVLVTSDIDWGQDLKRLAQELENRNVDRVAIAYNGVARLDQHGLPPHEILPPDSPRTGWVAVSLWKRVLGDGGFAWLDAYRPIARVGTSIDLYHIEELR